MAVRWSARIVERCTDKAICSNDLCEDATIEATWPWTDVGTIELTQRAREGCCDCWDRISALCHDILLYRLDGTRGATKQPLGVFEIVFVDDRSRQPGTSTRVLRGEARSRMWWGGPTNSQSDRAENIGISGAIPRDSIDYWERIWRAADADDSFCVDLVVGNPTGIVRRLDVLRGEPLRNTLQNLSSTGAGWTLWGRTLYLGDSLPRGRWTDLVGTCWEEGGPSPQQDASQIVNHVTVRGVADAETGVVPIVTIPSTLAEVDDRIISADGSLCRIGLRQRTLDVPDVSSQAELLAIGQLYLEQHSQIRQTAFTNDNSIDDCACPVPVREMIPGRAFNIDASGCVSARGAQRIRSLNVTIVDCVEDTVKVDTTSTATFGEQLVV